MPAKHFGFFSQIYRRTPNENMRLVIDFWHWWKLCFRVVEHPNANGSAGAFSRIFINMRRSQKFLKM
jgi:hypothetical protein